MSSNERFSSIIKKQIENYSDKIIPSENGKVISVGDGIVTASGLTNVMLYEIVTFENNTEGLVLNLEEEFVSIVLLGKFDDIKENSNVSRTYKISEVQVGDEFLGRVVDALAHPIDGKSKITSKIFSPIEKVAKGVMTRESVNQPLETGILTIDAMFPIGKGQRELIIGDRQTGKTTVAIDTIINQKGKDVYCVYVAIGQKASSVANIQTALTEAGAMDYTVIVSSTADDLSALNFLAPFTGVTLAEYWMSKGRNVLIIYDDLSKHAVAYRTLSLLLKRPPGREAYPGDVFYLHSRLLERACRLNDENGGGSITALPIVETQAGEISAYIPTNVISITDGQLFMISSLFNAGQRPAIDAGLSVSRVGSDAQIKCVKQATGSLKLDLANYSELQAFSQFGSDLDKETKRVLSHGEHILAMVKQKNSHPYDQIDETLFLFAIKTSFVDIIPLKEIANYKEKIISYFATSKVRELLDLSKEISSDIDLALHYEFKKMTSEFIKINNNIKIDDETKELLKVTLKENAAFKKVA